MLQPEYCKMPLTVLPIAVIQSLEKRNYQHSVDICENKLIRQYQIWFSNHSICLLINNSNILLLHTESITFHGILEQKNHIFASCRTSSVYININVKYNINQKKTISEVEALTVIAKNGLHKHLHSALKNSAVKRYCFSSV